MNVKNIHSTMNLCPQSHNRNLNVKLSTQRLIPMSWLYLGQQYPLVLSKNSTTDPWNWKCPAGISIIAFISVPPKFFDFTSNPSSDLREQHLSAFTSIRMFVLVYVVYYLSVHLSAFSSLGFSPVSSSRYPW